MRFAAVIVSLLGLATATAPIPHVAAWAAVAGLAVGLALGYIGGTLDRADERAESARSVDMEGRDE